MFLRAANTLATSRAAHSLAGACNLRPLNTGLKRALLFDFGGVTMRELAHVEEQLYL